MGSSTCAILSFRLGLTDGVSIVADHWKTALSNLGFEVSTVAGEGPVDVVVPWLAIDSSPQPQSHEAPELAELLSGYDLVVVENLLSIPLNLPASRAVAEVLSGRPAILHHHDPPWQRERFRHITEVPPTDPSWAHVTINRLTEEEFAQRGIDATTIYNGFDTNLAGGDREKTRNHLGVTEDEWLVGHPVRAIERKNIPAAIRLCEQLGATYWLLGDAEEGYGNELDRLLAQAKCRVIHQSLPYSPDIYAAPDLIAFPSTWEGFGNPPIEASIFRRPVAVGTYAVAQELQQHGFRWFDHEDVEAIKSYLKSPNSALLDHNEALAKAEFSLSTMTDSIESLLSERGWLP